MSITQTATRHKDDLEPGTLPNRNCPLCSRVFPQDQLFDHINSEHPYSRRNTIKVIQAYHSSWVEAQGACEHCWKYFRDAAQAIDRLKAGRRPNQIA